MLTKARAASFAPEGGRCSSEEERESSALPPITSASCGPNEKIVQMHAKVRQSLMSLMALLKPAIVGTSHDEAMIELALSPAHFVDPLSTNEVVVLACGLYMEHVGSTFDYNDVLALTHRFRGRAMNTTTVYNTLKNLLARGLVDLRGREVDEKTERLSKTFSVNEVGKEAFRLAIINAHFLKANSRSAAA